jgi:hypothetical protein
MHFFDQNEGSVTAKVRSPTKKSREAVTFLWGL